MTEVLVTDELDVLEAPLDEARNSIQGTATCLPDPELDEEMPVLDVLDELEELVLLGEVLLGELLLVLAPAPDNEIMANSSRPDAGLTIVSLIVPTDVPELPRTGAPVS